MLLMVLPLHALGVAVIWATVSERAKYFAVALGLFAALRAWKRAPLVELLVEVTLWSMLVSTLVNLPIALCVRLPVPFADAAVKTLDARLGLDVSRASAFVAHHPRLAAFSSLAYVSLRPIDILTLYVPVLARRPRWASEMFVALVLALGATLAIMLSAQAIGPWVVSGVRPSERQREIELVMRQIKHAPSFRLDLGDIPGFVAFPSWHVLLAMFSAFTIGRVRTLRTPCVIWALLVAISTLTTGWHYGVDVLSGVVVGCLALLGSRALHRSWDRAETARRSAAVGEGGLKTVLSQ